MIGNFDAIEKEIIALKNHIFDCKKLVICLHKRLFLIRNNFALKSDYEKNEIEIICHETRQQIISKTNKIREYQNDLKHKLSLLNNHLFKTYE